MADAGPEKWPRFRRRFWEVVELANRTFKTPRPDPLETGVACMEDVVKAIEENQDWEVIGPIEADVLNFSTKHPHPYKFFSPPVDNERMEYSQESQLHGKSAENSGESSRDPLRPRYQFDLLLSDACYNGYSTPIWCEITRAAALLLNVHATEFWDRTEEDQFAHVRDLMLRNPKCELYIRITAQKATVTDIQKIYVPVQINDRSGHSDDSVPALVWEFRHFFPDMVSKRPWHDSRRHIDKGKGKKIVAVNDLKTLHRSESGSEMGSWEAEHLDSKKEPHNDEEPELSGRWSRSPVRIEEYLNDERPIDKEIIAALNDLKTHHGWASGSESGSELGSWEADFNSEEERHNYEESELSGQWSGSELGSWESDFDSEEEPHNDEEPELLGRERRSPVRNEEPHHGVPVVDEEPDGGLVRNNPTPPFGAATVAPILEGGRRRHNLIDEARAKRRKFFKDAEV